MGKREGRVRVIGSESESERVGERERRVRVREGQRKWR